MNQPARNSAAPGPPRPFPHRPAPFLNRPAASPRRPAASPRHPEPSPRHPAASPVSSQSLPCHPERSEGSAPPSASSVAKSYPNSKAIPLTVVVVSYNVASLLEHCLTSVYRALESTAVPPHVVVVDNASADDSAALVRTRFPSAILIKNPTNVGFGAACNQGLALAGDAVLFLNPDAELAPDAVAVLLARLRQTPDAALVGPQLRYPDSRPQPSRRRFPTALTLALESTPAHWRFPHLPPFAHYVCANLPEQAGPADWLSGACLLGRTAALCEVGGFDPAFFMYFEEVDLSRRLAARGWRTWYEPAAVVIHHHSQSANQDLAARDRYYYRSKFRYTTRYFGHTTARLLFAASAVLFAAESLLQRTRGHHRLAHRHASLARLHLTPPP